MTKRSIHLESEILTISISEKYGSSKIYDEILLDVVKTLFRQCKHILQITCKYENNSWNYTYYFCNAVRSNDNCKDEFETKLKFLHFTNGDTSPSTFYNDVKSFKVVPH